MEKTAPRSRRKPGRPKSGQRVDKFTVMLPRWLHEWTMQRPEGFSAFVRRLLAEEHAKEKQENAR